MPSIRKRIGYLPSINAQETITKIANKEKLSQSKVVGILVEEALRSRGVLKDSFGEDYIKNGDFINLFFEREPFSKKIFVSASMSFSEYL